MVTAQEGGDGDRILVLEGFFATFSLPFSDLTILDLARTIANQLRHMMVFVVTEWSQLAYITSSPRVPI